jgi:hypothetical protein
MRGKVLASGTQKKISIFSICLKLVDNQFVTHGTHPYNSLKNSSLFAWKCVETCLHGIT